jgi:hypothetical protein
MCFLEFKGQEKRRDLIARRVIYGGTIASQPYASKEPNPPKP